MELRTLDTSRWHTTRITYLLAGTIVAISLLLYLYFTSGWLLAPAAFVALMQIQYAISGICPSVLILKALGFPE